MDSMEKIVSLCKRRGFIFPSSEIYGGLNGCWDYGPLGVELKRNLKQAWWDDMVAQSRRDRAAAGRAVAVRHGGPRQLAADEPAGLGGERPRRRLQRSDGRRPRDASALPRGSARGVPRGVRRDPAARSRRSTTMLVRLVRARSVRRRTRSCSSRIASASRRCRRAGPATRFAPSRSTERAAERRAPRKGARTGRFRAPGR